MCTLSAGMRSGRQCGGWLVGVAESHNYTDLLDGIFAEEEKRLICPA